VPIVNKIGFEGLRIATPPGDSADVGSLHPTIIGVKVVAPDDCQFSTVDHSHIPL
jgi:hypothetical protein